MLFSFCQIAIIAKLFLLIYNEITKNKNGNMFEKPETSNDPLKQEELLLKRVFEGEIDENVEFAAFAFEQSSKFLQNELAK